MVIVKYIKQHYKPKGFTGKTYDKVSIEFLKNNRNHRYYGPAYINKSNTKSWDFNGECYGSSINYSQKQFFKDINKLWLL